MHNKQMQILGILCCLLFMTVPGWCEKIAVLISNTAGPYHETLKGFEKNISAEIKLFNMEGNLEKGRALLAGLSPSDTRCLVTIGPQALNVVDSLSLNIPVVFSLVVKPVLFPNRKMTGVTMKIGMEEQLALIKKLLPAHKRIGIIYNPQNSEEDIREARKCVDKYQLSIFSIAISKESEAENALAKFTKDSVDLILMVVDPMVLSPVMVNQFASYSLANGIPLIGLSIFHAKAGALISFCPDYVKMGSQIAQCAQKILDGNSMPVQGPKDISIYLNLKSQQQLNVNVTASPDIHLIE